MRLARHILCLMLAFLAFVPETMAEEKEHGGFVRFFSKVGDAMTQSLMKGMDTTYVALPKNPFTTFAAYRLTSLNHYIRNQNSIWSIGNDGSIEYANTELEMTSGYINSFGVGIGYRNTMVRYYYTPGKKRGSTFNISSYGHRFGGEVMYQSINAANSHYSAAIPEGEGFNHENASTWGDIELSRLCINAYWVISPKKFSYPAAMRGSVIQKRSAGSFIANATYYRTSTNIPRNAVTVVEWMTDDMRIVTNQIGLGLGYAYNIVLPWNCMLIHLAATPMLTVNVKNSMVGTPSGLRENIPAEDQYCFDLKDEACRNFSDGHGVGFGCQGKVAVSIQISERFYATVDLDMFYFGAGKRNGIHTHTFDSTLNAVFGIRF